MVTAPSTRATGRPSETLRRHADTIRDAARPHGVTHPRVFGSVARGTETLESDLARRVRVASGAALGFLARGEHLSAELGRRVDVVDDLGLREPYRRRLDEAVPL